MGNIVLIGMMGSGKSTIGHSLKNKIDNFSFVDMDYEIEKQSGLTITQIFEKYGEGYFRRLETDFLKNCLHQDKQIVSTGGGIVECRENLNLIQQNSISFYLYASVEELFERVKKTSNRPLLRHPNPYQKIKELMNKREKYYKMANFEINTENRKISDIVDEIIEKYKNYDK